jgi:CheY-like chemotaxis protein
MTTSPVPRVLVVDDFPQVRELFGRFLTLAGMEPSFAADGVEALTAARASQPDLVLCDIEMPGMDGIALCAALRSDAHTRHLPIVAVTGAGGPAALAALAVGCDVVLPKPCSRALLMATIRDLLRVSERWPDLAEPPAEPFPE